MSSDPAKTTEEWLRLRNRFVFIVDAVVIDLNKNVIEKKEREETITQNIANYTMGS